MAGDRSLPWSHQSYDERTLVSDVGRHAMKRVSTTGVLGDAAIVGETYSAWSRVAEQWVEIVVSECGSERGQADCGVWQDATEGNNLEYDGSCTNDARTCSSKLTST